MHSLQVEEELEKDLYSKATLIKHQDCLTGQMETNTSRISIQRCKDVNLICQVKIRFN